MTTIADVLNGGDLKTLRAVVCGTTGRIAWRKEDKQANMVKVVLRDSTSYITALVFNERLFDQLIQAAQSHQFVKLEDYRRAEKPNTLIVGGRALCSVLATKQHSLTPDQIKEARIAMYEKLQPLATAKLSPNRTRVSVRGKISKVFPVTSSSKRVLLKEFDNSSETMVTIWQPQHLLEVEVGQEMTLYDARASGFNGGSIDTSSATHIEVFDMETPPTSAKGELVGFGFKGSEEIIEIVLEGDDDETTFEATPTVLQKVKTMTLSTTVNIKFKENLITEVSDMEELELREVEELLLSDK